MLSIDSHIHLARRELEEMPGADPIGWLAGQVTTLAFCDALDQLVVFPPAYDPAGFIAWMRSSVEHIDYFRNKNFEAIRRLTRDELTRGPVLYVAETWTRQPGAAAIAARELGKLPGVKIICAHVQGGPLAEWRWRQRRVRGR